MNYQELRTKILTGPLAEACAPFVTLPADPVITGWAARYRDEVIANILNASDPMLERVSRMIGIGTILDALGPNDGSAVLDALDALRVSSSPLKWAWHLLEKDGLDVGLDSTRAQIQALVGGPITQAQADVILALADQQMMVSAGDVSLALRGNI